MLDLLPQLYEISPRTDNRIKEILKEAKSKVARYFGIPEYFLNLRYAITKLPEIYEVGIKRIGNYFVGHIRRIGKVLGAVDLFLNPFYDIIHIDPINLYNEKMLREVIFHEVIHVAQKILGKIYKLPKYLIEREAHILTKKLAHL
jgi:hypothetical protein